MPIDDFIKLVRLGLFFIVFLAVFFMLLVGSLFGYYIHKSYDTQVMGVSAEQFVNNNSFASQDIK